MERINSTPNTEHLTACRNAVQALTDFGRVFAVQMQPALQQFGQSLTALYQRLRAGYEQAGKPYGDSEEGFHQWLQEVATAARQQVAEKAAPNPERAVRTFCEHW